MSAFDPLDHYPGVLERGRNHVDLYVPLHNRKMVTGLRLWGAVHPHHLYGQRTAAGMAGAVPVANPALRVAMMQVRPNRVALSASKRRTPIPDVTRHAARFIFDPDDFAPLSEDVTMFVAIQQERLTLPVVAVDGFTGRVNRVKGAVDTNDPIMGPILVVPSNAQYHMVETTLVITGDAPAAGAAAVLPLTGPAAPDLDLQRPNPLHLVLPRPTTSWVIRNTDAVNDLVVCLGYGQMPFSIPQGAAERTFFGSLKEIMVLSSAAGTTCTFSLEANVNLGGAAGGA